MKEQDYHIPKLYSTTLDNSKNSLAFGMPEQAHQLTGYQPIELIKFMQYSFFMNYQDSETNQNYWLFRKNLSEQANLSQLKSEATNLISETQRQLFQIAPEINLDSQFPSNYWRVLLDFKGEIHEKLVGTTLKHKTDLPNGPHVALQHLPDKSVLRVKASTLRQLNELLEFGFEAI